VQIVTHWKLTLSYDGTSFHGWQVQPGLATIQGTLAQAVASVCGETVLPQGSGRTDAGVHALAQVASLTIGATIPPPNFLRALNSVLPPSIRILAAEQVAPDFHARHSAIRKTYEYRIFERRKLSEIQNCHLDWSIAALCDAQWRDPQPDLICPPFLAPYVWDCRWPLDFDLMQEAAAHLCGEHDFASFAASDPDRTTREDETAENAEKLPALKGTGFSPYIKSSAQVGALAPEGMLSDTVRTLFASTWSRNDNVLTYRITGSGFLHHMVRNIVGTLADVGRGALSPADILHILAAKDRSTAGPTAPARGLFLVSVQYDEAQP
jgi:tRNA pseudouridine38-40 synthase